MAELIAQLALEGAGSSRVWRLVTTDAGIADRAWQQRDALLALGDGAAALEVIWRLQNGEQVTVRHEPLLPEAIRRRRAYRAS